jgi:hypothetical protein
VLVNSPSDTIVIAKENLTEQFFELKTGIAGEILQKFSDYRKRLVIPGDYSNIESKSLRDLIYESNKNGKVVFCKDIDQAASLLK